MPERTLPVAQRYWPLGVGRVVTSPFGPRGRGFHAGVDFGRAGGSANMPVYAVQSGTVIYAGAAQGYGGPDPAGWLVIDSTDAEGGGCLEYGHIIREVAQGAHVTAGQRIGRINPDSRTNGGTAPHLHLSDMPGSYNPALKQDPMPRLRGALEPPGGATTMPGWTGDPTWLLDVLKADGQINVRALGGWDSRGHGDFKDIRGVMFHHTGGPASAESIRDGRPDLSGPLSQLHISRDGVVTVVAVGVAWHAGTGSLPWVPANMGNWHLIGIECEWPYRGGISERNQHDERWRDPQIIAMRNVGAALCRRLGFGADRITTHKEYAGRAQGKWDPGNLDPDWLRAEIAKDLSGFAFPGEGAPDYTPAPVPAPVPPVDQYAGILLHRGMRGPAVVKLQQRLKAVIVSQLVVDGDFGPKTEAAVRAFQSSRYRRPPLVADGIVGPATAAQLGLVL